MRIASITKGEAQQDEKKTIRMLSQWMLPFMFLLWIIFLSFASPVFLTWGNLFNVTRQIAVIGILSVTQLLCILTGNIDLSVGAFVGLFGALLAGLSIKLGFPLAFLICVLIALLWGFTNGFLVTRGEGISVIVTLSTMYVARGITLLFTEGHPIVNFPMPFEFLGARNLGPVPYNLITFAIVLAVVFVILRYTPLGRHLYAVGGNKQAAKVCGINTKKLTIGIFMTSSMLVALGSVILLGRVASAQPTAGTGMEMDSMATVLIGGASMSGGRGGVISTLIGVFMLGFINNGLNLLGISGYWQYVFKGSIILVAVMVDLLKNRK
ncbi:MAG: ABC transporter permease [Anaerolineaceae bacterium]|nr:ABC transporter permease [Anaerolineaceae bacterium]